VVVGLVGVGVGVGVVVDSASVGVVAGLLGIKQSNEKTQKEFDNVKQRDQNNKCFDFDFDFGFDLGFALNYCYYCPKHS
jgi:hypothetical protein